MEEDERDMNRIVQAVLVIAIVTLGINQAQPEERSLTSSSPAVTMPVSSPFNHTVRR